jgi:hypothetical protein
VSGYAVEPATDPFGESRQLFATVVDWLGGRDCAELIHSDLETRVTDRFRELACQAVQDHLDLRAARERRLDQVIDADGAARGRAESGRTRLLTTVFGEVVVERLAYRELGHPDLHPADAALNLPTERHSHGLRRLAAIEASQGSFTRAGEAITRTTGQTVGKRQVEALAVRAAADIADFYAARRPESATDDTVLGMSADAKGVVMRREALRPATAKAATSQKLTTRLSAGEKRNRKRMAEVVTVFDSTPAPRTVVDILPAPGQTPRPGPTTHGKWLSASVQREAADMISAMFDEATRRDPDHRRTWICLLDGNAHQIDRVHAEAATRGVDVTVLVDFIHVLEYVWTATWCLHAKADPAAETWVHHHAWQILTGHTSQVIADLTTAAADLDESRRTGLDRAVTYLTNKAPYLDYPTALTAGWPIATGVIEGACRHLVKDRLDITGARWGLTGAEAILQLRALISNGDLNDYWTYHLNREHERVHQARYANNTIPEP